MAAKWKGQRRMTSPAATQLKTLRLKRKISKLGGKEDESLECFLAFAPKGKEVRFQRVLPYSGGVFAFVGSIVFGETR